MSKQKRRRIPQQQRGLAYRRNARQRANRRRMIIVNLPGYNPLPGWVKHRWDSDLQADVSLGYIVYPKNSKRQRYIKQYTGNVVKFKELPRKGNMYRRCVDYDWSVY